MAGVVSLAVLPVADQVPTIPRPALATVVLLGGASLIDLDGIRHLRRNARLQYGVAVTTLLAVLVASPRVDLAVLVGVGAAAVAHLYREEQVHLDTAVEGGRIILRLQGVVFYLSVPRIEDALVEAVADRRDVDEVVLDLAGVGRIDVSGALALVDTLEEFERAGLRVRVVAVPPQSSKIVHRTLAEHFVIE